MICKGCLFYILALVFPSFTCAVKVNMQGSVSLGKDVMDTISHYLINEYTLNSRRSMNPTIDPILKEVESANLCKKLDLCHDKLGTFVNEYIASLANAIDAMFEGIYHEKTESNVVTKTSIFEKLEDCLRDIRKLLKATNQKITDEKEKYSWVGMVKKIGEIFHRKTKMNIIDKLDADKNINEIKKKLTQKLVILIATNEVRAERILCSEHHVCLRSLECTKALNTVLERLKNLPGDKINKFMKAFYEALPETSFYSILDEATASEFQVILNDMAYFDSVPTIEILTSIQHTVENRIHVIENDADAIKGVDIQLVHIILADMDYIYSKQKHDPFHYFVDYFLEWSKVGGHLTSQVKDVVRNIEHNLQSTSYEIVLKLINEVKVFLELTVEA